VAFAPLLIATVIYAADSGRWTLMWVAAALLAGVKEDQIPILTAFGLYLISRGERWRGAVLAVSTAVAFFVVVLIVIPAFSDSGQYGYTGAFGDAVRRPWAIPAMLVTRP